MGCRALFLRRQTSPDCAAGDCLLCTAVPIVCQNSLVSLFARCCSHHSYLEPCRCPLRHNWVYPRCNWVTEAISLSLIISSPPRSAHSALLTSSGPASRARLLGSNNDDIFNFLCTFSQNSGCKSEVAAACCLMRSSQLHLQFGAVAAVLLQQHPAQLGAAGV